MPPQEMPNFDCRMPIARINLETDREPEAVIESSDYAAIALIGNEHKFE